ncbi:MAG: phosphoenolpyruvate--protein phosphotransferase [Pseudomonadota bacterium]
MNRSISDSTGFESSRESPDSSSGGSSDSFGDSVDAEVGAALGEASGPLGETRLRGVGVSPGIAIGRAYLVDRRRVKTPKKHVTPEEVDVEIARLRAAIKESDSQLERIKNKLFERKGEEVFHILEAHQLILHDEHLVGETGRRIQQEQINAEWALRKTVEQIKQVFDAIDDDYFRERRSDIDFVGDRILRNLLGEELGPMTPPPDAVVVSHDLSPGDTAQLYRAAVAAFVTSVGSKTSHTAIVARGHEIPAVVGIDNIINLVGNGDLLIVDGTSGEVILNPQPQLVADFRTKARREAAIGEALLANRNLPAETIDGYRVRLFSNIDVVDEIESALDHGAEGIGLFRTDFLFLNRPDQPSEEEHYEHARAVLERLHGLVATFRTFDLGGDKAKPFAAFAHEANPALGLRSIRLCLTREGRPLFKSQLRALLRASVHGPTRIMFPMISGISELRAAMAVLAECKQELRASGIPFDEKAQIGIMVEMPSAAMTADLLAKEVDFFSIGTNDLIQYALAIDRVNEHVSYLYRPLDPSILRIVRYVANAARERGIPLAMCGEMAGEPLLSVILMGLGLDELSMNSVAIPTVKNVLRSSTLAEARELADRALQLATAEEIEALVREHMSKRYPPEVLQVR